MDEYRAIVSDGAGKEIPFEYSFPVPDVNWGGYFHSLREDQVIRWEKRTISKSDWVECER